MMAKKMKLIIHFSLRKSFCISGDWKRREQQDKGGTKAKLRNCRTDETPTLLFRI